MYTRGVHIQCFNEAMLSYLNLTHIILLERTMLMFNTIGFTGVCKRGGTNLRLLICNAVVYLLVDTLLAMEDAMYIHIYIHI